MKEIILTLIKSDVFISVVFTMIVGGIAMLVKKFNNDKARKIYGIIVNAFNIAEKTIPNGTGPVWLQKLDTALQHFNLAYYNKFGIEPPSDIVDLAKSEWAILANELKKSKPSGV